MEIEARDGFGQEVSAKLCRRAIMEFGKPSVVVAQISSEESIPDGKIQLTENQHDHDGTSKVAEVYNHNDSTIHNEPKTNEVTVDSTVAEIANAISAGQNPGQLYCYCKQPWDSQRTRFMIQCDGCKEWFHGSCVELSEKESFDIYKYHCPTCMRKIGPSLYKDATHRSIKAGTTVFLEKLKEKEFPVSDEIPMKMRGSALTLSHLIKKGFMKPIFIEERTGLDIKVPSENFTVRDVEHHVGSDRIVDVIDVQRQTDVQMTMKEFADYFTSSDRKKLFNLISLEFSDTRLNRLVEAPEIARKLDWVQTSWPKRPKTTVLNAELPAEPGVGPPPPAVSKYCLISTKNSFTDFHIDFGGSSVYYTILWGEKIFYLVEPTATNLKLYERWMCSTTQYETFFGDMVDFCYQVVLKKGQTLFIPTGWIHGVLTSEDSLVFGGNFLHSLSMDLQLRVYEIEKTLNVPNKYLFPYFESLHWYAAQKVLDDFQMLYDQDVCPSHLVEGLKALARTLRGWCGEKTNAREIIPRQIKPLRLIKQLDAQAKIFDKRFQRLSREKKGVRVRGMPAVSALHNGETDSMYSISSPSSPLLSDSSSELTLNKPKLPQQLDDLTSESQSSPSSISNGRVAPIKLTLKRNPSDINHIHPSTRPGLEKSLSKVDELAGQSSPKDGQLKIRLSLSESRVEILSDNNKDQDSELCIAEDESTKDEVVSGSESGLQIDETVKKESKRKCDGKKKSHHKHHRHHHRNKKHRKHHNQETDSKTLDNELAGTLNGMEKLFKDSNYNERLAASTKASGRSNVTIAEIIENESIPLDKRLRKAKKRKAHVDPWAEENIPQVHQDADFIYLPLTAESDDEESGSKKVKKSVRKKKKMDKADEWSPGVKMGPVTKREACPSRANAKVKAVEKGLETASVTLEKEQKTKTSQHVSKTLKADKKEKNPNKSKLKGQEKSPKTDKKSKGEEPRSSTSSGVPLPKVKKPKKGYATAKQRLGKIIKINKYKL